ncbi:MAG: ArnT family glycosyltransferase [Phycisphaerales bacterium]
MVVFLALALPKIHQGEFSVDTGWYAAIAHQAWSDAASGNSSALWTLMGVGGREGGVAYFNKPPLAFWIHGALLWALGPELWAARLPTVLAGAGTIVLLVHAARRACGPRVALTAGLVLATTLEFIRHAHAVSLDMWNAMFLFGALACQARSLAAGGPGDSMESVGGAGPARARWLGSAVGAGVFVGAALMTKPLLGLVAPAMFAAAGLVQRRPRWWRAPLVCLVTSLLVAAPWHVSMIALHGEAFTTQYFGKEIAERAAGDSDNVNRSAASAFYYVRELAASGWPWALTCLLALVALVRRQRLSRVAGLAALLTIWTLGWFVLLSAFPDKRPRYLLVLYAPAAWLSALWIVNIAPRVVRRAARRAGDVAVPAAVAAGMIIALAPITLHKPQSREWDDFFAELARHPGRPLWQGAFNGSRAARVYLVTGRWPIPTHDTSGKRLPGRPPSTPTTPPTPPAGALIAYHSRDGAGPGPNERVVFQGADLTITELQTEPWSPASEPR